MANQKASLVNMFNYNPYDNNTSLLKFPNESLSLIKDSYSGKYYGSETYDSVISSIKKAESYFQSILTPPKVSGFTLNPQVTSPSNHIALQGNNTLAIPPTEQAKIALETIKSNVINPSNYVQKPQMVDSFNADPEGWNSYFESSYKNPRIAEANNSMSQRNSQDSIASGATGNQLIASNLEIRKEVGTGIGKDTGSLNPFGKLDAGLNI
jgi:hypothetical protein